MFHRTLSLCLGVSALLGATQPAAAQPYRPDADGYPCTAASRLAVLPDAQGFSIRVAIPEHRATPAPIVIAPPQVALGSQLRIDRALFARPDPSTKEDGDAADR